MLCQNKIIKATNDHIKTIEYQVNPTVNKKNQRKTHEREEISNFSPAKQKS
jgi:hypothetical protein